MKRRLPTLSSLGRAIACPASQCLPHAETSSEEARQGTANHSAIESGIIAGNLAGLPDVVREVIADGEVVAVERSYALDLATGRARVLGDRLNRDYSGKTATELAGTVDLVVRLPSGVYRAADWKSNERAAPVASNWQMKAAALAVAGAEPGADEADHVETVLAYLNDGETDAALVDAFARAAWWSELFKWNALENHNERIHSGPHCKYCNSIAWCPQQVRLALAMIGELDVETTLQEMTDTQAGHAWEKLQQIEALAKRIDTALRERARHSPLPLSNGRRLALVEQPGCKSLDQTEAKRLLMSNGLPVPMKHGEPFTKIAEIK